MPKAFLPKRTFGRGEIAPDFYYRGDTDQYNDGARKFRNARLRDSGSWSRRPGTYRIAIPAVNGIVIPFYFNNEQKYELVFSDGRMDAYLEDGTAAGSVTLAPWSFSILAKMRWYQEGDTLFLYHRDMQTQVIKRTGAASWSRAAYAFATIGNTIAQPYYKFSLASVTMQPSATTGSITLTASADVFESDHVGTRFRYLEREVQITAVTNATTATADVKEQLPAAQRLTVGSTAAFQVGQIVEHSVDKTKALVFNIHSSTQVDVIPSESIQAIPASGNLVGPDGNSAISATASATLPALTQWDEQVFSSVRGYPGAGLIHRDRKVFVDHKSVPDGIMMSIIGDYFNFDLGTGADSDAIFEFFGDGGVEKVGDLVSAESLLFFTNAGTYYLAERIGQPFTPSNFIVRRIDTFECGTTGRAGRFERNIYCPHANGKIIIQVVPTGDIETPWTSLNIALISSHIISSPVSTAFAERFEDYPERYGFFVNNDGTMAVLHSITDQNTYGFTLWETDGDIKSVAVVGDDVFILVSRTINGSTVYWLERFDENVRLDGAVTFSNPTGTISGYNNHSVRVTGSSYDFGDIVVGAAGAITVDTNFTGPFQAGLFYSPDVETLPPEIPDGGQTIMSANRRITKAYVHQRNSGRYLVNGIGNSVYRDGDDMTAVPPSRTEIRRVGLTGRSREPTIRITQTEAVPLNIDGITLEVAF